jgi:hypothetical protein
MVVQWKSSQNPLPLIQAKCKKIRIGRYDELVTKDFFRR